MTYPESDVNREKEQRAPASTGFKTEQTRKSSPAKSEVPTIDELGYPSEESGPKTRETGEVPTINARNYSGAPDAEPQPRRIKSGVKHLN